MKLTQSQYLLWAGQALSPDVPLYNMPFRFDIQGGLDENVFQRAFDLLVKESDAMRMIFVQDEENLPKTIVKESGPGLEVLDATNWDDSDLHSWLEEKNRRQFDLTEVCYESVLLHRGGPQYLWYLNQHHLITDAWGISVQFNRLSEIYQALLSENNTGDSLPLFSDYVEHEFNSRNQKSKKTYWDGELNALPPLPSLYNYNQMRLESASTRFFAPLSGQLSEKFLQVLTEPDLRSFTTHISRFSAYMTCLMAYIYRVSGQNKVVVGTPSHNRSNANFQNTPGVFIEFFPIAAEIAEGETLGSLYQKVRNKVMGFLMNADSGMANPELSSSFNVVLNYIHAEFGDFAGFPTESKWLHIGHCDPRHDLRVHVMDYRNDGQGLIMFDMNNKVFKENQDVAKGHFLNVFQQFVSDRSIEVDAIPLVSDSPANVTGPESKGHIHMSPNFQMKQGGMFLSNKEIEGRVGAISKGLKEAGVGPGDRVGLHLKRGFDFVCSLIAVLQSRATYVPLPYNFPNARVEDMCLDGQVSVLLTTSTKENIAIPQFDPSTCIEGSYSAQSILDKECIDPAYIMYTSGSTGKPKGVEISHSNLLHYLTYAATEYPASELIHAPLFTSIGFDLTVTSVFLPMIKGGVLHIYPEPEEGPDLEVLDVVQNDEINWIKWTPSHMEMVKDKAPMPSLKTMVVGGEDFKTELALSFQKKYGEGLKIINEYGPTEVTVGSIVHRFNAQVDDLTSVPIGRPMPHVSVSIMNGRGLLQPDGVSGEIWLGGPAVSRGYWNNSERTAESFIDSEGKRFYRTGDLAFRDTDGVIHFQGRIDRQVKVGGRRMEPQEIARKAEQLAEVEQAVVALVGHQQERDEIVNCSSCGLPSNFPGVSFNEKDECSLCENFDSYQERVKGYFKDREALQHVFNQNQAEEGSQYDCMMLLSGGKDSTYALAQLADMGLRVLAFTLDNGYISQGALDNARRVCQALGVDHVFGRTEHMNAIFVDSLKRFNNVCNGCFKVIYTLSTQIALEKKIPIIVTGLSRGQFFETRLTEELFWDEEAGPDKIDSVILNARKEYHRTEDAVSRLMDTSFFEDDDVFEKVKFVDFYRYSDVELGELMTYLKEKLPWVRPSDTGRSTNCLINQVGIHVHKNNVGYSNYAFPYSWDVRIGHKNRDESLEEINEEIDVPAVERIMAEIGYDEKLGRSDQHLTIFYKTNKTISAEKLKSHLSNHLPDFMVPWSYVLIDEVPLTHNGKVDYDNLIQKYRPQITSKGEYVAPESDFELMIAEIWEEVLLQDQISVHDKFLELGGNSLLAIRIISRMNKKFRLDLGLKVIFECPTIASLAEYVELEIRRLLSEMN